MANQKFIFINADNLQEDFAASITTSVGAADAGKLITLDASGKVDASMIDSADIDHGSMAGLLDDDHSIYTLASGARAFSGNQSMGNNKITSLSPGVAGTDAVNFTQLDARIKKAGDAMTGDLSFGGINRITSLNDGIADNDAATVGQVNASAAGMLPKDPCRVVRTAVAGDLAATYGPTGGAGGKGQLVGCPAAIDGITILAGDRILVAGQTDAKQNGIYEATALATTWDRASDHDGTPANEVKGGNSVYINEGSTANKGAIYRLDGTGILTLNTDLLSWVFYTRVEELIGGNGIDKTGLTISVDPDLNSMEILGTLVAVKLSGSSLEKAGGNAGIQIKFSTLYNDARAVSAQDLNSVANGKGASIIGLEDSAGNFTATNVEGALAEAITGSINGVLYSAATGGVSKGDLVEISGNDAAKPLVEGTAKRGIGVADSTVAAAASFKVLANDEVVAGVLTSLTPTAGDVVYWNTGALSLSAPSSSGSHVWEVGQAKNANDMHVKVRFIKKNV